MGKAKSFEMRFQRDGLENTCWKSQEESQYSCMEQVFDKFKILTSIIALPPDETHVSSIDLTDPVRKHFYLFSISLKNIMH